MPDQMKPSLYDRLGGVYNIAVVVDDFIDRIMGDPRLNANPLVDEAHHRVSPQGFKYLVTEMVCWAVGGPQQYSGGPRDGPVRPGPRPVPAAQSPSSPRRCASAPARRRW